MSRENGKTQGCQRVNPASKLSDVGLDGVTFSDIWPENVCRYIWGQLPGIIKDDDKVHGIHRVMVNGQYCYNPNLYRERGWCILADAPDKWGFCSASCDMDHIYVNNS